MTAEHSATEQANPLVRATLALEHAEALDTIADRLHPLARKLVADPTRRRLLQGQPMGHALHPILTDVPIGAWLSAAVLDAFGGTGARPAARRLIGFGVLAAVPTALTGWSEWADTEDGNRRVGVVHASANVVAVLLYAASWASRRGGHHRAGVLLSTKALAVVGAGGFLGAHLSLARKVSSRHEAFEETAELDATSQGASDDGQPYTEPGDLAAGGTA